MHKWSQVGVWGESLEVGGEDTREVALCEETVALVVLKCGVLPAGDPGLGP